MFTCVDKTFSTHGTKLLYYKAGRFSYQKYFLLGRYLLVNRIGQQTDTICIHWEDPTTLPRFPFLLCRCIFCVCESKVCTSTCYPNLMHFVIFLPFFPFFLSNSDSPEVFSVIAHFITSANLILK